MVNVELGRHAEGGRVERQRLHKAMSAWVFAAAVLLEPGMAGWVAAVSYAYADVRGMRTRRWKWLGSCGIVIIAAFVSSLAFQGVTGGVLAASGSVGTVGGVVLAAAAFLAVEAALFAIISRLNSTDHEAQLRAALASRGFYLVEVAVLLSGGLAAVLYRWSPAMLVLAVPGYLLIQRGMLHQPLQHKARHDAKTGVLNSEAWRSAASSALVAQRRMGRPVAVLIVDFDHFKSMNDGFGHLAGDDVLIRIAEVVVASVRKTDLVGRFGGDEFCALLGVLTFEEAVAAAERIRAQVTQLSFEDHGLQVTASIGCAVIDADEAHLDLAAAVALADQALYQAKTEGRNRVCGRASSTAWLVPDLGAQRSA
ncbi:MAG: diguanylate cyclase [Acidimicrobiales bacterium]